MSENRPSLRNMSVATLTIFTGLLSGGGHAAAASDAASSWMAPSGKDFPVVGGNLANQRYSALDLINGSNVKNLGGAWSIHLENGQAKFANMQAAPVVVDGVVYITTGLQNVFAVDGKTGALKWKYATEIQSGFPTNRGVAVADGKVFTGQGDSLIALDQSSGKPLWKTKITDQARGAVLAAPAYYDGLVLVGIGVGDAGARGQFGAYDAKTGKEVWKFWTVPGPGEPGHDTWEGDSWKHGGAAIWEHPAIDPELGIVYFGTGNASPDTDGEARGGDNLYTASVVALDLKTGKYKWHYQIVHHDLWDYDTAIAPVLADIAYKGERRKVLIQSGKTGFLYILDRRTGKPLIGISEKPVPQEPRNKTAKTQPFPIGDSYVPTCPVPGSIPEGFGADQISCIFAAYWDKPILAAPGTQGANPWAPPTFDPKTQLVYVCGAVNQSAFTIKHEIWDEATQRLKAVGDAKGYYRPLGSPRSGTLTAIDPATNRIVWQQKTKYPVGTGSGLLSTAGGLLFHGDSDGKVGAFDIRNGNPLWSFQTDAGADAPMATYEADGEQYLVILSGGNPWQLSEAGDSLWAFKLGGKVPQAKAPEPPPSAQPNTQRR